MAAVWELDLSREQKHVLLAFADHADDDGFCWPSLARIAWKCGYAQTRAVSEIVAKLGDHGVLVRVEPPHGRTPSKYQIRPWAGRRLPEFDPKAFKGAKNAPHDPEEEANALNREGISGDENAKGAESAPQIRRGAVAGAPQACGQAVGSESVGVRSSQLRGAISARRGALATAPESLTIKESKTRAREALDGGRHARAKGEDEERARIVLENSARLLGIAPGPGESLESLQRRVDHAHGLKLERELCEKASVGTS